MGAGGALVLVLLLFLLGVSLYLLYLNLPGEIQELTPIGSSSSMGSTNNHLELNGQSEQFYQNMRFPDRFITYQTEAACSEKKRQEVRDALQMLESVTILRFTETTSSPQIIYACSNIAPSPQEEGFFVAGEGGPTQVINTSLYAVILAGEVSFFREEKCDNPNTALHETLHVLGFDHNNNPQSIMYPTLDCDQTLDQSIMDDIDLLYEIESAPDLRIADLDASKSGPYLTFEIEIINQGLQDVDDSSLMVYHDEEPVEFEGGKTALELDQLPIGTTKILTVTNARISRFTETVRFSVDPDNEIEEIFEENNEAILQISD